MMFIGNDFASRIVAFAGALAFTAVFMATAIVPASPALFA